MQLGNKLLEMQEAERRAKSANGGSNAPGVTVSQAAANGCPAELNVGSNVVSIIEPIREKGNAQAALTGARQMLREAEASGPCTNFANQFECELHRRLWSETVRALECHAEAEARGNPVGGTSPGNSPHNVAQAGADSLLGMVDDPTGAKKSSPSVKNGGGGKSAASTGNTKSGATTETGFPTPYCRFVSSPAEKHVLQRYVCHANVVYECRDRTSASPGDAWQVVSRDGCGGVRDILAVERERRELQEISKGLDGKE